MPSKKKKYNARFPAGRIKRIMQTDEEVGKVAQAVPVIISRTLELFVHSLLTKTMQITNAKNAKTLSPSHMKQCILSESRFDFLKDLVKGLPDVSGADDDAPTPPMTPAPAAVNSAHTASLPLTSHSDGRVSKELSSSRRTSRTGRCSKDLSEMHTSGMTDDAVGSIPSPMLPASELLLSAPSQQPGQTASFQISLPPSFQVDQPNFYTELNPMNLTTSANSANIPSSITNQPTSNFIETANIDEDYDT